MGWGSNQWGVVTGVIRLLAPGTSTQHALACPSPPRSAQSPAGPTLGAWGPGATLGQLGASTMGPNVDIVRVGAPATIDGAGAAIWAGTPLDYTVDPAANTAKSIYTKPTPALGGVLPPPPLQRPNPFATMVADPRGRLALYWPSLCAGPGHKAATRQLANATTKAGPSKAAVHGGPSTTGVAG